MNKVASVFLFAVGVLTLFPIIVLFDPARIATLYGVSTADTNMLILLQHRGVLLAVLGLLVIASAFKSEYRVLAIGLAMLSKVVFIYLTFSSTNHSSELARVAQFDIGAIILLLAALGIHLYSVKRA